MIALLRKKSLLTNLICLLCALAGGMFQETLAGRILMMGGIFGVSGAATNWLAVYMLFEKIPLLYGSGIIPLRFEEFKRSIRRLTMETFFAADNLDRYIPEIARRIKQGIRPEALANRIDANAIYDELIRTVEESSFGGLMAMFNGKKMLEELREPFCQKIRKKVPDLIQKLLDSENDIGAKIDVNELQATIDLVITEKLTQLTPQKVKEIVEDIIRDHLGWLVIWGGFFGFLIGVASTAAGLV